MFEIANLVRTVHLIAGADGNLRGRLAALLGPNSTLPPSAGGYYFRYETAAVEKEAVDGRLAAFQTAHRGLLPTFNRGSTRALRLAARRAA